MTDQQHTPEPWMILDLRCKNHERITVSAIQQDQVICRIENIVKQTPISAEDESNARRIVACVNACAGIPTDVLEAMPLGPAGLLPMYSRLEQRATG